MTDYTDKINEIFESLGKALDRQTAAVKDFADAAAQKVKLRSEIGQNKRDIEKTYAKLGEAYYRAKKSGGQMTDVDDWINLITTKEKLIALLEEKLAALEKEETEG